MSGGDDRRASGRGTEHGEDSDGVREDRRLRVLGGRQLLLRPFEHQPAEGDAQGVVDGGEGVTRCREARGEVFGHPDFLDALPGAQPDRVARGYHCTTRLAQVKPAPNARSEEHTSELQSRSDLVCRLLLEKKKKKKQTPTLYTISDKIQCEGVVDLLYVPSY